MTALGAAAPAPVAVETRPRSRAFVPFVAACMSMVALSIDTILPAFDDMRAEFGLAPDATEVTWVLTAFFLGLAAGQAFFGTLSDRWGRRPLLLVGLGIYVAGAAAAALAPTLTLVIVARFVWGFGAAGPRSLAVAMVRDTCSGVAMARTMSFVMTIFMIVPVVAPTIGALLISVFPWQAAFWFPALGAVALALWVFRMPETLPADRRRPVSPRAVAAGARIVVRTRSTVWLGLAVTLLFGAMATYLGSSELIITETYDMGEHFPLVFGLIAVMMAVGGLVNSRLVTRFGVRRLLRMAAVAVVVANVAFSAVVVANGGAPPFWVFVVGMALLLAGNNLLLPNANTAAMEPMGAVAGIAASILGVVMTAGGAVLSGVLDRFADGTVTPLALGMLALVSVAAMAVLRATSSPPPVDR